jgi:hypothetical protein
MTMKRNDLKPAIQFARMRKPMFPREGAEFGEPDRPFLPRRSNSACWARIASVLRVTNFACQNKIIDKTSYRMIRVQLSTAADVGCSVTNLEQDLCGVARHPIRFVLIERLIWWSISSNAGGIPAI